MESGREADNSPSPTTKLKKAQITALSSSWPGLSVGREIIYHFTNLVEISYSLLPVPTDQLCRMIATVWQRYAKLIGPQTQGVQEPIATNYCSYTK